MSYLIHFNKFHDKKNGRFTFKTTLDAAKKDVDSTLATRKSAVDNVIEKGDQIVNDANALGEEYKKAYANARLSKTAKKKILDNLENDFGILKNPRKSRFQQIKDNVDDDEYFDMVLEEYIENEISNQLKRNYGLSNMRSEFEGLIETYWHDVHSVVDDIAKKYEKANIIDKYGSDQGFGFVNDYVYGNKMGTSLPSYITRHFDDYWVNDVSERYDAVKRMTDELKSQ